MARALTPSEDITMFALKVAGTASYSANDFGADAFREYLSNIERVDARVILVSEARRNLIVEALVFYAEAQSTKEAA